MSTKERLLDRIDASILKGRHILILDDELLVALETKAVVERFGGIVVGPYARVGAALEAIQRHPVDGAILDINVAGVQSFAVGDALQARRIPFVFCTGCKPDIVPSRLRSVAVVDKPVLPEILIAVLVKAMSEAAARAHR